MKWPRLFGIISRYLKYIKNIAETLDLNGGKVSKTLDINGGKLTKALDLVGRNLTQNGGNYVWRKLSSAQIKSIKVSEKNMNMFGKVT